MDKLSDLLLSQKPVYTKICKPPILQKFTPNYTNVFLAGSIEMGKAVDWQTKVTNKIIDELGDSYIAIHNPRRDDWDSSWGQSIDNPQFREQVEWELTSLDNSHLIALYLDKETKSPISLLEFGMHVRDKNMIVYCPNGFWRKGNIDVTCAKYGVPVYEDETKWINAVIGRLKAVSNQRGILR